MYREGPEKEKRIMLISKKLHRRIIPHRLPSISTLSSCYTIQALAHVLTICVLNIIQMIIDRIILKRFDSIQEHLYELKSVTYDLILKFSGLNPDLQSVNTFGTGCLVLAFILVTAYKFRAEKIICGEKLSILYFAYNPNDEGPMAISERLDHHLDEMISSYKCSGIKSMANKNIGNPSSAHGIINQEIRYLFELKDDKSKIWPVHRQKPYWPDELRFIFLIGYISTYICLFISSMVTIIAYFLHIGSPRIVNGINYPATFWSKKYIFDIITLTGMIVADASVIVATFIVILRDDMNHLKVQRISINDLIKAHRCLELLNTIKDYNNYELNNLRSSCNKYIIETYIKLRYYVDTISYTYIENLLYSAITALVIPLLIASIPANKQNKIENITFMLGLTIVYCTLDLLMFGTSMFYAFCSKEFNSLINILATIVLDHKGIDSSFKQHSDKQKTSMHTFVLCHRFIKARNTIDERFSFKLINLVPVDYAFLFRANIYISYMICLEFYRQNS